MSSTLALNLTLQQADRNLVVLDTMDRTEFENLAEGVATVRCRESLADDDVAFDAAKILGKLNVNRLLRTLLDRSESQLASKLLRKAKSFAADDGFDIADGDSELPIYQSYLADKLDLSTTDQADRVTKRHLESTQYRKKMVAAYLSICRELRIRHVPFASSDMVFGISDGCVRDCLSQFDHLFVATQLDLRKFLTTEIDWKTQAKALRAASEKKKESIPASGVQTPVETGRIVKGLAMITAAVQSRSDDGRHLRSPERGLFRLRSTAKQARDAESALALIQDAADSGFLRVYKEGDDVKHFHVHASLAPAYGFSYRRAHYEIKLGIEEFDAIRCAATEDELRRVTRRIARGISSKTEESDEILPAIPGEAWIGLILGRFGEGFRKVGR